MSVTTETVRRVARLARIKITDEEAERMTGELSSILNWVEQLSSVNVADVEPMTAVIDMPMRKRDDAITDGEMADKVVANAPAEDDHFFMVPKVVE
ncbi:MAG: Asp-tRNA(Asn)/Glu-tRNA(Gln) amidotransferase subunit GatC [Pseudomonadota bacterium]